jgi:hypothetical protein
MYKLQAKTFKEEPKNITRKRFRGGADEPAQMGTENSSAVDQSPPSEPLPVIENPDLTNNVEGSPAPGDVTSANGFEAAQDQATQDQATLDQAAQDQAALDQAALDQAALDQAPMDQAPLDQAPMDQAPMDQAAQDQAPISETPPVEGLEEQPVDMFGAPSEPESAITGDGESAEIEAFRNMMGTPESQQVYFYMNTNISTEENRDKSYKREGVLHFTDSVSVGASQNTVMSLGSVIGNRGIETTTYDKLRNVALQKVGILLGETRRCYNTKIGFERNGETILVHIYGTVYSKKSEQPTV